MRRLERRRKRSSRGTQPPSTPTPARQVRNHRRDNAAARKGIVNADHQRKQLAQIVLEEDLDLADVWVRYFAIGGTASEEEFALYAVGQIELMSLQRDLISIALRELVDEH